MLALIAVELVFNTTYQYGEDRTALNYAIIIFSMIVSAFIYAVIGTIIWSFIPQNKKSYKERFVFNFPMVTLSVLIFLLLSISITTIMH